MNAILADLNAVPAVIGSCVFDDANRCVALAMPPPYEPLLLQTVFQELRSALSVLGYLDGAEAWNDVTLQGEGGYASFRRAGGHTLFVLAGRAVNLAMLGVGATVAGRKLEQMLGRGAPALPVASPAGSPAVAAGPLLSASSVRPESLPRALLQGVATALARQLGPIARLLVEQELERLQAAAGERPVPARELVGTLVQRIAEPERRKAFLAEVESLIRGR